MRSRRITSPVVLVNVLVFFKEQEVFIASLRALGNRTRLAIVSALMEDDYCNHELSADLGLSLSLTSHHP